MESEFRRVLVIGRGGSATRENLGRLVPGVDAVYFCNGAVDLAWDRAVPWHCWYVQYDGPTHPNQVYPVSAVDPARLPKCIRGAIVPLRERRTYPSPLPDEYRYWDFHDFRLETKNNKPVPTAFMAMLHAQKTYAPEKIYLLGMDAYRQQRDLTYSAECRGPDHFNFEAQRVQIVERMPEHVLEKLQHFDGARFCLT